MIDHVSAELARRRAIAFFGAGQPPPDLSACRIKPDLPSSLFTHLSSPPACMAVFTMREGALKPSFRLI
jgi:hypothetical protein